MFFKKKRRVAIFAILDYLSWRQLHWKASSKYIKNDEVKNNSVIYRKFLYGLKSKACFFHRVPLDEHIRVSAGSSWPHRHISAPVSAELYLTATNWNDHHFYTSGKKTLTEFSHSNMQIILLLMMEFQNKMPDKRVHLWMFLFGGDVTFIWLHPHRWNHTHTQTWVTCQLITACTFTGL